MFPSTLIFNALPFVKISLSVYLFCKRLNSLSLLKYRYLASGESMISLSYCYRVGKSTTSGIIAKTCQAIWNVLKDEVLPSPTAQDWAHTAQDFGHLWNFPNCVGAIDGKHIIVQVNYPMKSMKYVNNYVKNISSLKHFIFLVLQQHRKQVL